MKTQLPEKYYLDHFNEFLTYIVDHSQHLLAFDHLHFIERYQALSIDAQCLLVRFLNRSVLLIDQDTLRYQEITDLELALKTLHLQNFIRPVIEDDWPSCLNYLTKPQLSGLLNEFHYPARSAAKKGQLIEALMELVDSDPIGSRADTDSNQMSLKQMITHPKFARFWVNASKKVIDYFLFLYFGNLNSRLSQFSLRDLGVIQTTALNSRDKSHDRMRFSSREEALSSYFYATKLKSLEKPQNIERACLADTFDKLPMPIGSLAQTSFNKYTLKLARWLERDDEHMALRLFKVCTLPEAEERELRLMYKLGDRSVVQQRLEALIDKESSEHLLTFAEDFLARKFNKKRTSQLTDVIRAAHSVPVDEMFRQHVELGVCNYYRSQGIEAYETENVFWRTLFGLVFWDELFGEHAALCNEFDRLPDCLKDGSFYGLYQESIDDKSQQFSTAQDFVKFVVSVAVSHYGEVNGLVRWSPDLADFLQRILTLIPTTSVWQVLMLMAQDYMGCRDGFPDLMVVDQGRVRFEEVKAPGDSLRQNQLVTLKRLNSAGIDSRVIRVNWITKLDQPYVVVDIETTGGKKDSDRITEIGMVKLVAGEEVARWQSLINPERSIPLFITELTGISHEMVKKAPRFSEVADSLADFLEGGIFVAHNVNFDYGFIKAEYARLSRPFSMPKLCTVKEMKRQYPGYESYGLAKLSEIFDITLDQHHRALSDALAAAELLRLVTKKRTS